MPDTQQEATVLAKYIGAKEIVPGLLPRYNEALGRLSLQLDSKEGLLMQRLLRHPFLLPLVDGGLALVQPQHTIRKRLLLMSALMETETDYAGLFLTKDNIAFAGIQFLYRGGMAVLKGLIGACLLKCLRWS